MAQSSHRTVYRHPIRKEYRGDVSKMRHLLDRAEDKPLHSPKFKAEITQALEDFCNQHGIVVGLGPTTTLISNGQLVTPVTVTGTGTKATFTVAGSVVTAIALSA